MSLPPFQRHSVTSREAALAFHHQAPTLRARVWRALEAASRDERAGLTDREAAELLDEQADSVRPRRVELMRFGLVVDGGRTRRTPSGRRATVWRVASSTEKGEEQQ
jgi:hypothetical protein